MSSRTLLIAVILLLGACDDLFDSDEEIELGNVFYHSTPAVVTIPDSVFMDKPFRVVVRTFGDSCFRFDRTEIETFFDDDLTEIRPFDRRKTDETCEPVVVEIDHTVKLRFGMQGVERVRVIGNRLPGGANDTIEKYVVVIRPDRASH